MRFDLLVFWGCIIVLHFFTNKLIFKFIGFWLSGEHKGNESARMSLVIIFSPILDSFFLLQLNARMDVLVQSRNWYSRVPSKSNPSDSASRLQFSEYRNSVRSVPDYSLALKALENSWKLDELIEKGS